MINTLSRSRVLIGHLNQKHLVVLDRTIAAAGALLFSAPRPLRPRAPAHPAGTVRGPWALMLPIMIEAEPEPPAV